MMRRQCKLCNNYDDVHAKDCPHYVLQMIANGGLEIRGPVKCYNGCYDSATQRVIDEQNRVMALIKAKEPDAHHTYFPAEGYHRVHKWGWPISGERSTKGAAIAEAYEKLFGESL